MASVIVRYQGTIEIECSNRAAKHWEDEGEVLPVLEKAVELTQTKLEKAINNCGVIVNEDVELEVEEANTDE